MKPHHEKTIQKLKEVYEPDDRYLALIIVGSVAAGTANDASDVDHILVVTDEEFERRCKNEDIHYWTSDFCDYPGGYVEGKIVNYLFIEEAVTNGSEPARAQFIGAKVIFSKLPGLDEMVARISEYPEQQREDKIRSFYAQMKVLRDYLEYGEQKKNQYIIMRAASGIALFGGRLILAHNRILYPYHKWFMRELRNASEKPSGFIEALDALLESPTTVNCDKFCNSVIDFMNLHQYESGFISRFVLDTEWNWLHGPGPVEDW